MKSLLFRIRIGTPFYKRSSHELWLCWEYLAWFRNSDGKWVFAFNPAF